MARYVEINLDAPRKLRFTWGAMRELEKILDAAGFTGMFDPANMGFEWITQLLLVGLKYGDPSWGKGLNAEKVDELIQEYWLESDRPLTDLMDKITEGMRASGVLPKEDSKEGKAEPQEEE